MKWGRWISAAVILLAGLFAWHGGVHSVGDYRALKERETAIRLRIDSLAGAADSMRAYRDSLLSDSEVQERVVREVLGMVRPGELSVILIREQPR